MKKLTSYLVVLATAASLTGCLIRTGPNRTSSARSCPPSYPWEGGNCVHNGRARGHHK